MNAAGDGGAGQRTARAEGVHAQPDRIYSGRVTNITSPTAYPAALRRRGGHQRIRESLGVAIPAQGTRLVGVRSMRTAKQTPEQRCADVVAAQEFHQIQKFAAACRRQWPGAKIVLRPNEGGPPQGADAPPPNQNLHQKGPDHVSGI